MSQFKSVLIGPSGGEGKPNWDNVLKYASFFLDRIPKLNLTYLISDEDIFSSIRFSIFSIAVFQLTKSGVATLSKFPHVVTSS